MLYRGDFIRNRESSNCLHHGSVEARRGNVYVFVERDLSAIYFTELQGEGY